MTYFVLSGNFTLNGNNLYASTSFDYESTQNQAVTIRTIDSGGLSFDKSFTINISNVNENPILAGTKAVLGNSVEDTAYTISTAQLVQGYTDPDGNSLSVSNLSANYGTITNVSGGNFTFTPQANYNGLVSLSYNITDGNGGSVAATQSFSLTAVNDAPTLGGAGNIFKITGLSSTGANVIEHNFVTGDDRGGIALSASQVFYTGDNSTGRFSSTDLNATEIRRQKNL
jgi:hypothetical protein